MPEYGAGRFLLEMKQVHQLAQAAVVAFLGLFELHHVLPELLLIRPGGSVNSLQHGVSRVTAPIGPGYAGQVKGLAQFSGRRQVWTATQIDKVTLLVQR